MAETILLTGGAGYIGSHTAAELLDQGARVVVVDNLSRGNADALTRAARVGAGWVEFEQGDVGDADFLRGVFQRWSPDAVVHLAAFKSVEESVRDPDSYERNNVMATSVLADAVAEAGVRRVVYASTAAVYGNAETPEAISEEAGIQAVSPYADTKFLGEQMLDTRGRPLGWGNVHLRFFNVCGAHPSGQLGEYVDRPQNLLPILLRAVRDGGPVSVFGTDYPTSDGTCVRDYVHVMDIANALLAALSATRDLHESRVYNVGTGTGSTVREVIAAVSKATGHTFDVVDAGRRAGDPAICVAATARITNELDWRSRFSLEDMATHAWAWMQQHQQGD